MKKNNKIFGLIILVIFIWQCSQQRKINIYMIGDSTMAEYSSTRYPLTGWGMKLPLFFNDNVAIYNVAVSGSSTKRFRDKLKWKAVYDSLKKGDYLFIQFGHNDEKKDKPSVYADAGGAYSQNLKRYINEAKDKGVIPVLLTSIRRRKFDENGKLLDTHGKYPAEMRKVAKETNVPLIDLTKMSKPMIEGYGVEGSKKLFRWVKPGEYPAYPDGKEDDTHFSPLGAMEICKQVVKGIKELDLNLKNYIVVPDDNVDMKLK